MFVCDTCMLTVESDGSVHHEPNCLNEKLAKLEAENAELREALSNLTAKVLETAQLYDDTETGGKVFMPEEDEWGEIVGIAREVAKREAAGPEGRK